MASVGTLVETEAHLPTPLGWHGWDDRSGGAGPTTGASKGREALVDHVASLRRILKIQGPTWALRL